MLFGSRQELKHAIDTHNIKDDRDIKYLRNENGRVKAICKNSMCKWFIYANRLSGEVGLQIRKWNLDHTCIHVYDNKTLSLSWLAKYYAKKFRNSLTYKASDFIKEMGLKLGQHMSKWMAWRAKVVALKSIYGNEDTQHKQIWNFCTEVVETNPATKYFVKTIFNEEGQPVFQRWYLCWTGCRSGFSDGCRKLIGVDGFHLKNNYGGQLLDAIAIDPNNNIFPITYVVVEVENKQSYEWFLNHLADDVGIKSRIVEEELEHYAWTFISDKQK
ncbi:hypothetical protein LIER_43592 [Lithospermum erythrorhizon]|uniref:Transposase MuDR plant domain-containing protein n=1 Tax=Lithospermum erythrorhizon TaxID=34254 RepID=A0AAV3QFL8_LITER